VEHFEKDINHFPNLQQITVAGHSGTKRTVLRFGVQKKLLCNLLLKSFTFFSFNSQLGDKHCNAGHSYQTALLGKL